MTDPNLDWKKVFKKILGAPPEEDNMISEQNNDENVHDSWDVKISQPSNKSMKKMLPADEHSSSSEFDDQDSPDYSLMQYCTVEELTAALKKPPKMPPSKFTSSNSHKVPEWNKVFKEILGNKPDSVENYEDENSSDDEASDKYANLFKHHFTLRGGYHGSHKTRMIHQSDDDADVDDFNSDPEIPTAVTKEVREFEEILARSRLFVIEEFSLNYFDGAGVDCFKDGKSCLPRKKESYPKDVQAVLVTKEESDRYWNERGKGYPKKARSRKTKKVTFKLPTEHHESIEVTSDVPCIPADKDPLSIKPLKGFIANMKYITRDDILNAPPIPFDEEPWDNDFYF